MQILNCCVILRGNTFSITERRGFNLFNDVEKPAASGSYLKLSAFEIANFWWEITHIFMPKAIHTSLCKTYSINPTL